MLRCEKQIRLRYRKGGKGNVSVIREHYLRDDIPCKVDGCVVCEEDITKSRHQLSSLSPDASHYVIPDATTLGDYLELFEHPSMSGLILLQTSLSCVRRKKGQRLYNRVIQLLRIHDKHCVMFSNENHFETFVARLPNESMHQWQQRLIVTAAVWYSNHIQAAGACTSIVIVCVYPELFTRLDFISNVTVISLQDYLLTHLSANSELLSLHESLTESVEASKGDGTIEALGYTPYLPDNIISEGLKKGNLFSGYLRVTKFRSQDRAFVSVKSKVKGQTLNLSSFGDILIHGNINRNRAINNDVVVVKLLPKFEWKPRSATYASNGSPADNDGDVMATGVIVGILSRNDREYVASFSESMQSPYGGTKTVKVLVCPYDIKIPKVRISTKQAEELQRHRIVIRIDSWDVDSYHPNGHFVRSIGPIGNIETETSVILIEHELITNSFSKMLLRDLPTSTPDAPWTVESVSERRDLRNTHLIFSIDPQGCEDVDDALSIRTLKHGRVELGVHIADVSHFVTPGSSTDQEARSRSTSIYLADRRYDMLPSILSADLCSLLSNADRYAVSVLWKLDSDYQVMNVWYGRTIIRSKYKLAYEIAQALFDGISVQSVLKDIPELQVPAILSKSLDERVEALCEAIKSLVDVSRVLKHRRAQQGALDLESVEVKVQISDVDPNDIQGLVPKQSLEMHEVIAECMIFANHWVAKKINEAYPTNALLRRHPPPSHERLDILKNIAGMKGFTIATDNNKALAESLNKCIDPNDPNVNRIIRTLTTRLMNQAEYFSAGSLPKEDFLHYGLALDLYTHFTSPIRRYADLVVHRQLLSALDEQYEDASLLPGNKLLAEMAQHMNTKHRSAQLAQIASTELFQCLYFASLRGPRDSNTDASMGDRRKLEGVIVEICSTSVTVLIARYGIQSSVNLSKTAGLVLKPSLTEEAETFVEGHIENSCNSITVKHSSGEYTLRLFDTVLVQVSVESSHTHGLSTSLKLLHVKPTPSQLQDLTSGQIDHKNTKTEVKKALVQTVQVEAESKAITKYEEELDKCCMYKQSPPDHSLYCLIQEMYKISLTAE